MSIARSEENQMISSVEPEEPEKTEICSEKLTNEAMEALEMKCYEMRHNRSFQKWSGLMDYFIGADGPEVNSEREAEPVDLEPKNLDESLLSEVMKEISFREEETEEFHSIALHSQNLLQSEAVKEEMLDTSERLADYEAIGDGIATLEGNEADCMDDQEEGEEYSSISFTDDRFMEEIDQTLEKEKTEVMVEIAPNSDKKSVDDSWEKTDFGESDEGVDDSTVKTVVIGASIAMATVINLGLCKMAELVSNLQ